MGRHSAPGRGPYLRSLVAWLLPWVVLAALTGAAVWIAVGELGGETLDRTPRARSAQMSPEPRVPSPSPSRAAPSPAPSPSPARPGQGAPDGSGVTVQVLNGSSVPGADERMAEELAALGYTIVAVQGSSAAYGRTTVFWSSDATRRAAEELAAYMGWVAEPKPANLSGTVDLHVVVGADEAS